MIPSLNRIGKEAQIMIVAHRAAQGIAQGATSFFSD
jgi:hypothetical protein